MSNKIIDWEKINRNLPYGRTPGDLRQRRGLWRALDVNDNGFLSLAEVTRGVRDVLALEEIFHCRPAVNAAFHHCRDIHKVKPDSVSPINIKLLSTCSDKTLLKIILRCSDLTTGIL